MIDHFSKLIETVSQDANYKPNEPIQLRPNYHKPNNAFFILFINNRSLVKLVSLNFYKPIIQKVFQAILQTSFQ